MFQHALLEEFQLMEILLGKNTAMLIAKTVNTLMQGHAQLVKVRIVEPVILQLLISVTSAKMDLHAHWIALTHSMDL